MAFLATWKEFFGHFLLDMPETGLNAPGVKYRNYNAFSNRRRFAGSNKGNSCMFYNWPCWYKETKPAGVCRGLRLGYAVLLGKSSKKAEAMGQ